MPSQPTPHPFEEWFTRNYPNAEPEKREELANVWNSVVDAAMTNALHIRDAFTRSQAYEYAIVARDVALAIGANGSPPIQVGLNSPVTYHWDRQYPPAAPK